VARAVNGVYLTTAELGSRWKISPKILANWRSKNIGPRFQKIGEAVRYPALGRRAMGARRGVVTSVASPVRGA
jgi:hypothetical protein